MPNWPFACPVARATVTFSTHMRTVRPGFPLVETFGGCTGQSFCGVEQRHKDGTAFNWSICPEMQGFTARRNPAARSRSALSFTSGAHIPLSCCPHTSIGSPSASGMLSRRAAVMMSVMSASYCVGRDGDAL